MIYTFVVRMSSGYLHISEYTTERERDKEFLVFLANYNGGQKVIQLNTYLNETVYIVASHIESMGEFKLGK